MTRSFSMVNVHLFDDPKMKQLSTEDKLLMTYLLVNKHINMVGFDLFDPNYAAHDLALPKDVVLAGMENLHQCGKIHFDLETSVLYVREWYKHNRLKTARSLNYLIQLAEDDALPSGCPEIALMLFKDVLSKIESKRTLRSWKRQFDFIDAKISELEVMLADDSQNEEETMAPVEGDQPLENHSSLPPEEEELEDDFITFD